MTDPVAVPRELGVAMSGCPVCGAPQKQLVLPDGGVSVEDCPNCYPSLPAPEKASATVRRERGTTIEEN